MHPRTLPPPHRSSARGFTLLELLVAVVAGLVVSISAFALSKQGTRFFHQETRLADAQFETMVGFERLRADIARAGYLSTPNIQSEPYRCPQAIPNDWPQGLKSLGSVRITQPDADTASARNDLKPSRIYLTGSYTTDELFPVRAIIPGSGSGDRIYLNATFGPMARLLERALGPGETDPTSMLQTIFAPGRAVRILDQSGGISFGVIASLEIDSGTTPGTPIINLLQSTKLPFVRDGSRCGIAGNETGAQLSVINWISYELAGSGDDLRLLRREIDFRTGALTTPTYIGAPEVVAERAVDLQFGMTYVNGPNVNPQAGSLVTLDLGHGTIPSIARDVTTVGALGPQHIRAVRARLSVRSREGDREATIPAATGAALYRYELAGGTFARVRSTDADIFLPNFAEVIW